MPELPEVETVKRGLAPVLEDRRLTAAVTRRGDLRWPLPPGFAEGLVGRRVLAVRRRAKFLLVDLDDGRSVIGHLGMSGRWRIHPAGTPVPEPGPHDHVDLVTEDGWLLRYHDPRRFGFMAIAPTAELARHPLLAGLGPEPLDPGLDGPALAARLAGRRGPVKTVLLDQKVIAGLGNIYVCEALFRARISPKRRADTVRGRRADRLAEAIRAVLREAVTAGGSSLRDHRRPDGELGYFQTGFRVYGRTGAACPGCDCDLERTGGIRHITQSGRSTFYCPTRQR